MKNYDTVVEKMDDGKDKEILKAIGSELKPYVKKQDGFAKKIAEDIEITYKDYDGHENTLKIPAGSIVKVMDYGRTEIVTEEDFNEHYVFHSEEGEKPAEDESGKVAEPVKSSTKKMAPIGIESMK